MTKNYEIEKKYQKGESHLLWATKKINMFKKK